MKKLIITGVILISIIGLSGVLFIDLSGDGQPVIDDLKNNTNPLSQDTSGNGLTDYEEVNIYETDPTEYDTNGNGLSDYEEVEKGLDPTVTDTSNNGLPDVKEIEYGTDPTEYDTVGDGLPDGLTYHIEETTPLEKNVFVYITSDENAEVPVEELQEVQEIYDNAPVENEYGDDGINLHLLIEDKDTDWDTASPSEYQLNIYQEEFDYKGYGVYHSHFSDDVDTLLVDGIQGFTIQGTDGMVVQADEMNTDEMATAIFMHELGHQVGLWPDDFEGIDSQEYEWEEYPSVMNYNLPIECGVEKCDFDGEYKYSDGEGFDDWEHIEENLSTNAPDTTQYDYHGEILFDLNDYKEQE